MPVFDGLAVLIPWLIVVYCNSTVQYRVYSSSRKKGSHDLSLNGTEHLLLLPISFFASPWEKQLASFTSLESVFSLQERTVCFCISMAESLPCWL